MNQNQINLGFRDETMKLAEAFSGLTPARVIQQEKDLFSVSDGEAEYLAEVSGKLRYNAADASDFPVVGDFVMLSRADARDSRALIHAVLPRRSLFSRRAAGTKKTVQPVASNIDFVFLCMALNQDYNLRRLGRYVSVSWDSGATPVVVLTKADLSENASERRAEAEAAAPGVDVLLTSSMDKDGFEPIKRYIRSGATIAFLGSSGVGKSTLINRLLGEERIRVNDVDRDGRGRHTTTRRELFLLPGGGAVIDTPGMRELGIDSADVDRAFLDISGLSARCRFIDCTHNNEPGCAVREAIEDGLLTEERLQSYRKLRKEADYEGLNSRQIEKKKIERMFSEFDGIRNANRYIREKNAQKGR